MAERRMFAKSVIDSDMFLDLPLTTQALYFHFSMRADDDGFVNNPKRIQRSIGCSDDDLKLLAIKSLIIPFDSGIIVIRHWKMHNYIRSDRYSPTKYLEEKEQIEIGQNGEYLLKDSDGIPDVNQTVDKWYPQVRLGKVRLGKARTPIVPNGDDTMQERNNQKEDIQEEYSVVKENTETNRKQTDQAKTLVAEHFETFWKAYPKKTGKGAAEKSFEKIRPTKELFAEMMAALEAVKTSEQWQKDSGQFIPNPATWLNQKRWEDSPNSSAQNINDGYVRGDDSL